MALQKKKYRKSSMARHRGYHEKKERGEPNINRKRKMRLLTKRVDYKRSLGAKKKKRGGNQDLEETQTEKGEAPKAAFPGQETRSRIEGSRRNGNRTYVLNLA